MFTPRSSGVLLHPTSLPSPWGIGDLGPEAFRFVDWLAAAGQRWWQILPLNPTLGDGSPYMSPATFAGNPLLISPDRLVEDQLIATADLGSGQEETAAIDFDALAAQRQALLRTAHEHFRSNQTTLRKDFEQFCQRESAWLVGYAEFMAAREANGGRDWHDWSETVDETTKAISAKGREHLASAIDYYLFEQFIFDRQWHTLREHASAAGIGIIGDLPIYVATNSADVWANRELFLLDAAGVPTEVSGVPPDYFSETGQLWNNPLYDWERLESRGYDWWLRRLRRTRSQVDVARLDHFRGFESYWAVAAEEPTAVNGEWRPGPREKLFEAIGRDLGADLRSLPLIAEDLGLITEEVTTLRKAFGLPGMKVLQFELLEAAEERHWVEGYEADSVVYSGTHDNDTSAGWYEREVRSDESRREQLSWLSTTGATEAAWKMIELAWRSGGDLAIAPMQDLLALPSVARMNTPGTSWPESPNWRWRLPSSRLNADLAQRLAELTKEFSRRVQN